MTTRAIEPVLSNLGELLNATLTAADVGLNLDFQDAANSVTLSSEQGLGRIAGEDVGALRENLSRYYQIQLCLRYCKVPLIEINYDDEQILTLASGQVTDLQIGNRSLWHFADGGFGYQINGDGDAWLWQTSDNERVNGFVLSDKWRIMGQLLIPVA